MSAGNLITRRELVIELDGNYVRGQHQARIIDPRPTCRECGCSETLACPGGCGWAEPDLCTACVQDRERAVRDALSEAALAGMDPHETLLGVAVYAARILKGTDGMWPPAARATECRRALQHIEAECRRVHAAVTTDEGAGR